MIPIYNRLMIPIYNDLRLMIPIYNDLGPEYVILIIVKQLIQRRRIEIAVYKLFWCYRHEAYWNYLFKK